MSTPNQTKPGGKTGQRSRKPEPRRGQKAESVQKLKPVQLQNLTPVQPQGPKPVQLQSPKPDQQQSPKPQQDGKKQFDTALASANSLSIIDFQTIATAYADYTKKSFEQTKSFVEKLSGARSLDKAIEIQTEFARQAYETFVAESQKIRELYSGLAKQSFKPMEGFVAKVTQAGR
jgi:hypothetical protein